MRKTSRSLARMLLVLALSPCVLGAAGTRDDIDARLLAAQNQERLRMNVPALSWDDDLARGAGDWARYLSRSGKFQHSPDDPREEPIGENIWGGTPGHYSPEQMIALWVSEKRNFRAASFADSSRSGRLEDVSHYTQLIWRRTTHVGCAVSADGTEEILVCRYRTAGNVLGQAVL